MLGSIGTTTSLDAAMLHSSGNRVAYGCGGGVGYNRGEGMMDCSRRASSSSREHYGDGHGVRIMGGVRADEISDEEILARIQDERRLSRNAREQKRFDTMRCVAAILVCAASRQLYPAIPADPSQKTRTVAQETALVVQLPWARCAREEIDLFLWLSLKNAIGNITEKETAPAPPPPPHR